MIDSAGRRIVPIPPGRAIAGDSKTKKDYCAAFQKYTWVLRQLRSLARNDDSLPIVLSRVADLEIAFFTRSRIGDIDLPNRTKEIPNHLRAIADQDEDSLFWTLGPGGKAKKFWAVFDGCSVAVLTGKKKTPMTLNSEQIDTCLEHFGCDWFPLSNSKTAEDRDSRGLGEYFAQKFGSPVFASHFAAVWVHQGRLEAAFKGGWSFRVLRTRPPE